ncbi:MAG TPA: GNAT family N-acetyltransferase [Solirubrobacteraceae bacterium]|jgi:RimJ/RimL family protein N-acetyltransferase
MSAPARLAQSVRRHGVRDTARRSAAHVTSPLRRVDTSQIWYHLRLDDHGRPRRELDPEFLLRKGSQDDAVLFEDLPTDPAVNKPTPELIASRATQGAQLWVVVDGDRAAFCCWTFATAAPIWGAKGNLALPPDIALLEDSYSSPHVRGRGVAPGAWTKIADTLQGDGFRAMITKVDVRNQPSRRAVEKAGFREIGVMRIQGRLGVRRIRVEAEEDGRFLRTLERG